MANNYIRIDENGYIIKSYSDGFYSYKNNILETDICVNESGSRHFNLDLFETNGCPKYKYINEKIVSLTETDKENWKDTNVSKEILYQERVKELVKSLYDIETELGLTNDAILSQQNQTAIPQVYWDYRSYVEACKDTAHMEVFGVERT